MRVTGKSYKTCKFALKYNKGDLRKSIDMLSPPSDSEIGR